MIICFRFGLLNLQLQKERHFCLGSDSPDVRVLFRVISILYSVIVYCHSAETRFRYVYFSILKRLHVHDAFIYFVMISYNFNTVFIL